MLTFKMKITFYLTVLIMFLGAMASTAQARNCYSAKESEAEQGIKIHSELMVIGLNCQHMTPQGWKNFYQEYREITSRNQSLYQDYEKTLIGHYGRERKIHDLRTQFANRISTNAAAMRPDVFCATYAPRIPKVAQMSRSELQAWAASAAQTARQSKPRC